MSQEYSAPASVTADVVLVRPEIAPNTGNIIRLCANVGARLHLVEPLGFSLDDRLLRRGGLDYHERTSVAVYPNLEGVLGLLPGRRFAFSSQASERFDTVVLGDSDTTPPVFVFGSERSGLGPEDVADIGDVTMLTIPMRPGNRSLNLANAVAVVTYQCWSQLGFRGAGSPEQRRGLTSERPGLDPFDG